MDLMNSFMNWVAPPASLVMLAFAWPALSFLNACEWLYNTYHGENMEDKVVIITGASSGIGEVRKLKSFCELSPLQGARAQERVLTKTEMIRHKNERI